MALGYVALVLHAHLPFVRHPEHRDCLEERWLFEANTECYLPLLAVLDRLEAEGIPFRLTVSLSPTLLAMLDDPLLRDRYQRYLEGAIDLADREVALLEGRLEQAVAHFYRHHLRKMHKLYTVRYARDLVSAFHRLARAGYVDLITCAATHGFLPLLQHQPEAVRAQVQVAVHEFRRRFGHPPRGFWLPECGYFPGVDRALREAGVEFCFVETHGLSHARPAAPMGPYSHGWTPGGVAVFGRDLHSSKQVWSASEGYPGDHAYREFYRDIGFDREPAHLGALAGPPGVRTFTGFKYHRVTGQTEQKELYDRWAAEQTATRHAAHFVHQRSRQVDELRSQLPPGSPPPLVVSPYDAELFGHWWFEGPYFLEQVARFAAHHTEVRFVTPADYLAMFPGGQGALEPAYSSWGYQGYADFWCDGDNHWVYRHLHGAGRRMVTLAHRHPSPAPQVARALNQAARELLLAQASDWPFIMRTGTTSEYARHRFQGHLGRFRRITDDLADGREPDPAWLAGVEAADNLFPDLSYQVYLPH
jgi:1,4-alpha-glucan branching enzyme